jgi:long-chain acyl-CoA synthetase
VIISGGTNIYPREVEEVLLTHAVHEVSVVGPPPPNGGRMWSPSSSPPGRNLDRAALDAHCLDQIARFKRPKAYFAVNELPKNNYGKVLKTELAQNVSRRRMT